MSTDSPATAQFRRSPVVLPLALSALTCAAGFILMGRYTLAPATLPLDAAGYALGRDFVNVWNGARLALAGEPTILFDRGAYQASLAAVFGPRFPDHNWSYPPHALLLFWGFGALPYLTALALWATLTGAAFLAAVAALAPVGRRRLCCVLAAISPASVVDVAFGQNGHLTGALTLGAFATLDRRPRLAGVLIGLLTVKPHLGLLLPFALVAIGAWRTIGWAALTTLALVALSIVVFGLEPWRLYFGVTTGVQSEILTQGVGGFVTMMPTVYQAAKALLGSGAAWPAQALATAMVLPLVVFAFRRTADPAARALMLTAGTLLALPYAFNYDMTALSGAIAVWAATGRQGGGWLLLAWVAPIVIMPVAVAGAPLGPVALIAALAVALRAPVPAIAAPRAREAFFA
ncbi:glycosyltransferase family 87 protein [Hansschlegelia sp.]|uniref:glycosyltransferase family 87 protein n=1 Tax=Hansschlegelia sp. TaxID=2041892 RepID=UPI002C194BA5|nr:glycosyltransferase family 87 protein [Hansschlegelia sp.]HVI28291.1 glycosyltransferase family 87 protein [Hansschlegelia sp.]